MDDFKHANPKIGNQLCLSLSKSPHRIIKFLISVSLFSVSMLLLPFVLQSFKAYLMQVLNCTIDKSYMFLLCNGLLVFLAKNSGLIDGPSPSAHQTKEFTVDNSESDRSEFKKSEITAPIEGENGTEIVYPQEEEEEEEEEEEKSLVIAGQGDGFSDQKEEAAVEEGTALMIIDEEDTEDINKKCEDFIRKMKAAFCSEPRADYCSEYEYQRAIVAVN